MQTGRITIKSSDVVMITGDKIRTAQRVLARIRKKLGKDPKACITIDEFSNYQKIDATIITAKINSLYKKVG